MTHDAAPTPPFTPDPKPFFTLRDADRTTDWRDQSEFQDEVRVSQELHDRVYRHKVLKKVERFRSIDQRHFNNVSFSKTTITKMSFKECRFTNCLFIDTDFVHCEFHNCYFLDCNMYKASFDQTYVDPESFRDVLRMDPVQYSNIGLWLFKSLAVNSEQMGQEEFRGSANFYFRLFERHHLWNERQLNKIGAFRARTKDLINRCSGLLTGYGWRPRRVVASMIGAVAILLILNYSCWSLYGIEDQRGTHVPRSLAAVFSYTLNLLTTLGPVGSLPTTPLGTTMSSLQGVVGVILFAFIASIAFRFVIKTWRW